MHVRVRGGRVPVQVHHFVQHVHRVHRKAEYATPLDARGRCIRDFSCIICSIIVSKSPSSSSPARSSGAFTQVSSVPFQRTFAKLFCRFEEEGRYVIIMATSDNMFVVKNGIVQGESSKDRWTPADPLPWTAQIVQGVTFNIVVDYKRCAKIAEFKTNPDDVFIVTYPKSGEIIIENSSVGKASSCC